MPLPLSADPSGIWQKLQVPSVSRELDFLRSRSEAFLLFLSASKAAPFVSFLSLGLPVFSGSPPETVAASILDSPPLSTEGNFPSAATPVATN